MHRALRFAFAALALLTVAPSWVAQSWVAQSWVAPAWAEEPAPAAHAAAQPARGCLDQKERRIESEAGHVVPLATAMLAAKRRMPGSVVRARLCHGSDGLVYVLTVLPRDGKVARLTVDAVNGRLVGGL